MSLPAPDGPRRPSRVLVVAASGYGRSSALEAASTMVVSAAALLDRSAALPEAGSLGVDDLDDLTVPEQQQVCRRLGGLDPAVRLTVASRTPLAPTVRRLLPQPMFERGPRDLALDLAGVADTLRDEYDVDDVTVASAVLEVTGGWPILVQLAGDLVSRGADPSGLLGVLAGPGGALASWVEDRVLATLPGDVGDVLEASAHLEHHHPQLYTPLGCEPGAAAAGFAWLSRVGLLLPQPGAGRAGAARLVPVVAGVLRHRVPHHAGPAEHRALAAWYDAHGLPLAAAHSLLAAGDPDQAATLVERRADQLLRGGHARGVVDVLRTAHGGRRTTDWEPSRRRLLGHALWLAGESASALRELLPLAGTAPEPVPPGVAWPAAAAHYSVGEYPQALDLLARARPAGVRPGPDDVEVLTCRSHAAARLGRDAAASAAATDAVRLAQVVGDDGALGSAHLAAAFTSSGDTRELHLAQALAAARRCGDRALEVRVLLNQADALLAAARYRDALVAAEAAVAAAEHGSPPGRLVAALSNQGDALRHLGRYDEAELALTRSVGLSRRHGLRRTSSGLRGLAELHRARGRFHQAAAAYEQAVEAARAVAEVQVLVLALSGLAELHCCDDPDPARARAALAEAFAATTPEFSAYPHLAAGRLALQAGDSGDAAEHASRALAAGRAHETTDAVAEALELVAAATPDPGAARAALREAEATWAAGGAEPAADRVRVQLARLPDADPEVRLQARASARRLRRLGVHTVAGAPLDGPGGTRPVQVRLLDRFSVLVDGREVPLGAWRSRQARSLVKILATRRGAQVRRAEICDLLWPDDDPRRTGHRLSVLLSAVRNVLDPDRSWPTDHFVRGDLAGLSLDLRHVDLDVERFLADGAQAGELLRNGQAELALDLLRELTRTRGEVLEEDLDAPWADSLREEVRAATLRAVRQLARLRARQGDHQEAAALLLRLLAADPYDESAHRAMVRSLVRAGRHGEARRAFARWADAMRAIDVPLPDPAEQLVMTPR